MLVVLECDTRAEAEDVLEAVPELGVHPAIHHRVVTAVAHGKPVAGDPDHLDVAEVPDLLVSVAHQGDCVQGQPAEGVDDHHCDHHLYHLKKE